MAEMYDMYNTQEEIDSAEYAQKCCLESFQHSLDERRDLENDIQLITEI